MEINSATVTPIKNSESLHMNDKEGKTSTPLLLITQYEDSKPSEIPIISITDLSSIEKKVNPESVNPIEEKSHDQNKESKEKAGKKGKSESKDITEKETKISKRMRDMEELEESPKKKEKKSPSRKKDKKKEDDQKISKKSEQKESEKLHRKKTDKNESDIVILLSGCHSSEKEELTPIIEDKLGASVVVNFNEKVTHIVVGKEIRRTLNVLKGIISGKWIASSKWIQDSMKYGKWMNPDKYEISQFSGAKSSRKGHEDDPLLSLFKGTKFFIHGKTNIPVEQLSEIIRLAGGKISSSLTSSEVCLCAEKSTVPRQNKEKIVPLVMEKYIVDCIAQYSVLSIDSYAYESKKEESK